MLSTFHDLIVTIAHTMSARRVQQKKMHSLNGLLNWKWGTYAEVMTRNAFNDRAKIHAANNGKTAWNKSATIIIPYYLHLLSPSNAGLRTAFAYLFFPFFFSFFFVIAFVYGKLGARTSNEWMYDKHRRVDFIYFSCGWPLPSCIIFACRSSNR